MCQQTASCQAAGMQLRLVHQRLEHCFNFGQHSIAFSMPWKAIKIILLCCPISTKNNAPHTPQQIKAGSVDVKGLRDCLHHECNHGITFALF